MEQNLNISIYKAGINDKGLLDNLLQLYFHDLSEFIPIEVGPTGKYEQNISPQYVSSFDKQAYIIHAEYHIIGFVLIEPEGNHIKINDLFVLNMWRGKGVGSAVVNSLLKQGKSIVCQFNKKNDCRAAPLFVLSWASTK
jgi:predicted acetyltransferase